MNETFVDPDLDALICNVSAMCSVHSVDPLAIELSGISLEISSLPILQNL